jgi:hypothetical protein
MPKEINLGNPKNSNAVPQTVGQDKPGADESGTLAAMNTDAPQTSNSGNGGDTSLSSEKMDHTTSGIRVTGKPKMN